MNEPGSTQAGSTLSVDDRTREFLLTAHLNYDESASSGDWLEWAAGIG